MAILIRYGINEEEYRRQFWSAKRKNGETNREIGVRLTGWQGKWLKEFEDIEDIMNAVGKGTVPQHAADREAVGTRKKTHRHSSGHQMFESNSKAEFGCHG